MLHASGVPLLLVLSALPCVAARGQSGAPAAPPATVVGTWRGTSICRPVGKPTSHDEIAVYHFRRADSAAADSAAPIERLMLQGNKIVNGVEEEMGTLACTYDPTSGTVLCPMRGWRWVFRAAVGAQGATLSGTLENPAGAVWRDVRVTRISDAP